MVVLEPAIILAQLFVEETVVELAQLDATPNATTPAKPLAKVPAKVVAILHAKAVVGDPTTSVKLLKTKRGLPKHIWLPSFEL